MYYWMHLFEQTKVVLIEWLIGLQSYICIYNVLSSTHTHTPASTPAHEHKIYANCKIYWQQRKPSAQSAFKMKCHISPERHFSHAPAHVNWCPSSCLSCVSACVQTFSTIIRDRYSVLLDKITIICQNKNRKKNTKYEMFFDFIGIWFWAKWVVDILRAWSHLLLYVHSIWSKSRYFSANVMFGYYLT